MDGIKSTSILFSIVEDRRGWEGICARMHVRVNIPGKWKTSPCDLRWHRRYPSKVPTPSPKATLHWVFKKTLTTPTAVRSGREEFFTCLEGEREGTYFSRSFGYYVLLHLDNWRVENSTATVCRSSFCQCKHLSKTAKRNVWLGLLVIQISFSKRISWQCMASLILAQDKRWRRA